MGPKPLLSLSTFCNFWQKLRELFWQVLYCLSVSPNFSQKLQKEEREKKDFDPTEYSSAIAFMGTKDEDTMYQGANYSKDDSQ